MRAAVEARIRRFGISYGVEGGKSPVGGRDNESVAWIAAAHWPLINQVGGWRPRATAGYVWQELGGVNVALAELPADLRAAVIARRPNGDPNGRPLELRGRGARLGVGAERALGRRLGVMADATVDMVRFGRAHYNGDAYQMDGGGWSTVPRLTFGFRVP